MKKSHLLGAVCVCLAILSINVSAVTVPISFSFVDDPTDWSWINRSYAAGGITGTLFGLDDNGLGQIPTSIEFTSDVSSLGMTSNLVNVFTSVAGTGFDVVGGVVIAANIFINFDDPVIGDMQIRFGYTDILSPSGANTLHSNGSSGPVAGMGNIDNGFSGATYSASATPIPPALWLFGSGLLGLIGMARRKKA
jgi:hypothetical protein